MAKVKVGLDTALEGKEPGCGSGCRDRPGTEGTTEGQTTQGREWCSIGQGSKLSSKQAWRFSPAPRGYVHSNSPMARGIPKAKSSIALRGGFIAEGGSPHFAWGSRTVRTPYEPRAEGQSETLRSRTVAASQPYEAVRTTAKYAKYADAHPNPASSIKPSSVAAGTRMGTCTWCGSKGRLSLRRLWLPRPLSSPLSLGSRLEAHRGTAAPYERRINHGPKDQPKPHEPWTRKTVTAHPSGLSKRIDCIKTMNHRFPVPPPFYILLQVWG